MLARFRAALGSGRRRARHAAAAPGPRPPRARAAPASGCRSSSIAAPPPPRAGRDPARARRSRPRVVPSVAALGSRPCRSPRRQHRPGHRRSGRSAAAWPSRRNGRARALQTTDVPLSGVCRPSAPTARPGRPSATAVRGPHRRSCPSSTPATPDPPAAAPAGHRRTRSAPPRRARRRARLTAGPPISGSVDASRRDPAGRRRCRSPVRRGSAGGRPGASGAARAGCHVTPVARCLVVSRRSMAQRPRWRGPDMTARISLDPPRTLVYRLAEWYSRRALRRRRRPGRGHGAQPARADDRRPLRDVADTWKALDPTLKALAEMAAAVAIGCSWCVDFGYWVSTQQGRRPGQAARRARAGGTATSTPTSSATCWRTRRR